MNKYRNISKKLEKPISRKGKKGGIANWRMAEHFDARGESRGMLHDTDNPPRKMGGIIGQLADASIDRGVENEEEEYHDLADLKLGE